MASDIELKLSKNVPSSTEESEEHTPINGAVVKIKMFVGEAAFDTNAVVRVEWDGVPIWTIKGAGKMPFEHNITDCDGTKKLKLICENNQTGAIYMSGYVFAREYS